MTARTAGSRFLYEPFDATSARLVTLEKVSEERWLALERRLGGIETLLDRMERRIWMAVTGVAATLAAEALFLVMSATLNG